MGVGGGGGGGGIGRDGESGEWWTVNMATLNLFWKQVMNPCLAGEGVR